MDFWCISPGLYLFIQLIVFTLADGQTNDCRLCKPGYYASRQCSGVHDTVCKPCSKGSFSPVYNKFETCSKCSICEVGEFVLNECTRHSDTVCESCSIATDVIGSKSAKDCFQNQNDQPIREKNNIKIQDGNADKSGNVYEGSGEHVEDIHVWATYETLEGSGESPDPDTSENITYVVLPIDGDGKVTTSTESTTEKTGVVIIEGGIVLDNTTDKLNPNVVISNVPSSNTTTIPIIILEGENGSVIPVTDGGDGEDNVDVVINDRPHTGASKGSHTHSDGMSIGVVVTVGLVAALVFFILGFLASKYWSSRRDRTFNVLEAERRNGKPPVECSNIEYRDPEGQPHKANHYEEIPTAGRANGRTNESLPIKPASALTTNAAPPQKRDKPESPETEADAKARAGSEIRYIDEEAEETETDRLLPGSGTESDVSAQRISQSSGESESAVTRISDETTPMLAEGADGGGTSGVSKTS
ncbi:uncharacterized protein LOC128229639 isoform X2 [Mya arenaria]|uniref:uncharacterized protein LOC128229639 isoform X2 n=1 Tax=Mya arenaria TaxID=6604 RepID=UPI0022E650ED|nr:uncharacterized protein LOC128229639 isoform X2 [Mya arenaria]